MCQATLHRFIPAVWGAGGGPALPVLAHHCGCSLPAAKGLQQADFQHGTSGLHAGVWWEGTPLGSTVTPSFTHSHARHTLLHTLTRPSRTNATWVFSSLDTSSSMRTAQGSIMCPYSNTQSTYMDVNSQNGEVSIFSVYPRCLVYSEISRGLQMLNEVQL